MPTCGDTPGRHGTCASGGSAEETALLSQIGLRFMARAGFEWTCRLAVLTRRGSTIASR